MVRKAAGLVIAVCVIAVLLRACTALPPLENRGRSAAVFDTAATRLGRAITPLVTAHPGVSGIYALRDARDAFATRYLLASAAERTLDVQYYIWRNDMSGRLLFKALRDAANRGVRVRLLLDDNNTSGLDPTLAALDAHPNLEVRLFNPFVIRRPRAVGYLTDFTRLNRRMHNKSFTADGQASIVGGRNVGDEYFGAAHDVLFADLDVVAIGPVVEEVSKDFERYWDSPSAYPLERVIPHRDAAMIGEGSQNVSDVERDPRAVAYLTAVRNSSFSEQLVHGQLPLDWCAARMMSDDPAKGLGRAQRADLLRQKLRMLFGEPRATVDLVSPYFVPGAAGVETFSRWARRGVRLRVLTNSLEATDVTAVHAGYARRRKALLASGVTLYELRRSSGMAPGGSSGIAGSSGASLHAKIFAVDGSRVFVGSFNFDPRSAELNTEMGFVIDSRNLAHRIESVFSTTVPANAYEVRLTRDDALDWIERRGAQLIHHDTEPGTTVWRRASVWLLSRLPIEWLLFMSFRAP